MNYVLDVHTHSLSSGHAYNTIKEMATSAVNAGLQVLGITEHAPAMPGTCNEFYFNNYKVIDREAYGVRLMMGTELNIMDAQGRVDLPDSTLRHMDIVIASLHTPCIAPMSEKDNTSAILHAMEHPLISIIGHPDDARYPLDYPAIAKAAAETHTLLEVNNSSLLPNSVRQQARENYCALLTSCMEYGTHIVLNSDAHTDTAVGRHDCSEALIRELSFPQELIINTSVDKFYDFIALKR